MGRRLWYAARIAAAGPVSAAVYLLEELSDAIGAAVVTREEMDAAAVEPDADPPAGALTGLDAERWVNGLRADYHAADAVLDAPNCGEWDCKWCWVNATGATG